ncbi:MAG: phage terminase large subunit [Minisyncoccia bacterium]
MENKIQKLVSTLYKIEGSPLILSPSQLEIFTNIFYKKHPYNIVIAFTRYGKSLTTALAVLTRCLFFPEKWAIVAPTEKQAKIIMEYIIDHLFDNEFILSKLQLEGSETLERLKRERSKRKITLKVFSSNSFAEIYILSAHGTKADPLKSLLGFGASNIIIDESSLIDDQTYAGILRMLGDTPQPFLIELGNPIRKNHFYNSFNDEKFHSIIIDYKQGLKEGRITQEQVEMMKKLPFFDILYECKFPVSGTLSIFNPDQLIFTVKGAEDCNLFTIGTDLAISEKDESDYSAIVVAGKIKDENKIRILESYNAHFNPNQMINLVAELYKKYSLLGPTLIGVENVAYQKMFGLELERRFLISPTYISRTIDKKSRLLMLNPYFQNKQIEFYGDESKFHELINQLLNFGMEEHDDLADAFEMSISLMKDFILNTTTEKPKETKNDPDKEELMEAIQNAINPNPEYYDEGDMLF